ncbi:MAG: ATP-binding protein [Proteobacteria bacterium]|nr:ATP-binding protein [Pseudomonadota bacterium]
MTAKTITILVVDDNKKDAEFFSSMLKDARQPSFTLEFSDKLIKTLQRLEKPGIDLVLLDLFLPESKGIKTLHKVHQKTPTIPIIALTGFEDEETGVRAVREGAQDYLVKGDVDKSALIRSIHHALERSRAEEALKSSEKQYRKLAERLQAANEELKSFTYLVSHDLRAPLRAVTSFSEILVSRYKDRLDEKAQHYLDNIVQAGKQMGMLIDDLLTYSRLGQETIVIGDIDLRVVFSKVTRSLEMKIKESGGEVSLPDSFPGVRGHETLLIQIYSNLITNALTFHREGILPEVTVTCEETASHCVIHVSDNGIGVPKDHYERIFNAFQRLHSQDVYAGTGIGLAIVKKAVDLVNGRVFLESEEGKGSIFSTALPLA